MRHLKAQSVGELASHLRSFEQGYLFRGQTKDYLAADGLPNINSSFARSGCIEPLMLKWLFYATELLRRGGIDVARPGVEHIVQGLLQHYGWRSFYVDLSSSAAVAAWFASHKFSSKPAIQLCENALEQPVMLRVLSASYSEHKDVGYLYVLSKERLRRSHEVVSLVDDLKTDVPTRFQVQKAWLAGIFRLQSRIDPSAIVAQISAPASVFQELASSSGYTTTDNIFPPPTVDGILENLLSLPRVELGVRLLCSSAPALQATLLYKGARACKV